MPAVPASRAVTYGPHTDSPALSAFLDCRPTPGERIALAFVIAVAFIIQLSPIMNSPMSGILVLAMACVSWMTPITGFFYIAWTQSFPELTFAGQNPAQLGFLLWLPVALFRYRRLSLGGLNMLWPLALALLWLSVVSNEGFSVFRPTGHYMLSVYYMAIACQLANEARGRYLKCLIGLCLGAWMVGSAYWAGAAGLPVELSTWGGEREGFYRLGGVGTDSVMLWPAVLTGAFGLVGIAVTFLVTKRPTHATRLMLATAMAIFLMSLPPLAATMTQAAYVAFFFMVGFTVWILLRLRNQGQISARMQRTLAAGAVAIICLFSILWAGDFFLLRTRALAMTGYYVQSSSGASAVVSRSDVWQYSIDTILRYPVLGVEFAGAEQLVPREYAGQDYYLSHNIFLDYGRAAGLPGMALIALVFFFPIVTLVKRMSVPVGLGFIFAHTVMFAFWMSLSFVGYKTFWALWMLEAMSARAFGAHRRWRW